jgi:hypothetical protein
LGHVIVLIVGAALDLFGAPLSGLVIDAAFVWLGLDLLLGKHAT